MSNEIVGGAAPGSTRSKVGRVVGIMGFGAFAVLGIVMVVLMIAGAVTKNDAMSTFGVGAFPWLLGLLAIGIVGVVIAGAGAGPVDVEEAQADAEQDGVDLDVAGMDDDAVLDHENEADNAAGAGR